MTTQIDPTIKPIATTYRGVRMRSRLEARWAATFDALGWRWRYEPQDLAFYIPDFVLDFDAGLVAVEVKPCMRMLELRPHAERMVSSGWGGEILAVGSQVFPGDVIGLLGDDYAVADGGTIELDAGVAFFCISCGAPSLRSENFSHRCRRCGEREGHVGALGVDFGQPSLEDIWAAAGNRVQWRPTT